ncbi:uncharacterized protein C8Q71DRAFT_885370 [Rhodofomes roseus]|uniref:Uncharacterized protein n=1 Tax=Rhodofomes roseus TaxID=34475 RepID=A0ABQ8KSV8_9APHY|nr:uncharacterized protein C8Q71DRAFT_885370 [Rhodofomes roseus]KAH9841911.1 hypothetical protein C8Q71DRAFT_885370 [Rhodofomes roseus]
MPHYPPPRFPLSPKEHDLKKKLRASSQLESFDSNSWSLVTVPYPCYEDETPVPLADLERYSRERCWPDDMRCFCDLRGRQSRPPRVFVPQTGQHAGFPCLGCRSYGRVTGNCSYFVNIAEIARSADVAAQNLMLGMFPRRVHNGTLQGVPMTPMRAQSPVALVGVGIPSIGSLSPLTPVSSIPSAPSSPTRAEGPYQVFTVPDSHDIGIGLLQLPVLSREDLSQPPTEAEITDTLLSLLSPSSPGLSMADLARVIGKCRLCNKCMGRNIVYLHQCGGWVDTIDDSIMEYLGPTSSSSGDDTSKVDPEDMLFAGNSHAGPSSPKSLKGKGKAKAIVGQQPDIVIDLSVAEEEVYYVVQPDVDNEDATGDDKELSEDDPDVAASRATSRAASHKGAPSPGLTGDENVDESGAEDVPGASAALEPVEPLDGAPPVLDGNAPLMVVDQLVPPPPLVAPTSHMAAASSIMAGSIVVAPPSHSPLSSSSVPGSTTIVSSIP